MILAVVSIPFCIVPLRHPAMCGFWAARIARFFTPFSPLDEGTLRALRTRHDGRNFRFVDLRLFRGLDPVRMGVCETMTPWELVLGSVMAFALTVYLVYAMLRPERF
jgi:K+-transporting ATPase KdpF subunit